MNSKVNELIAFCQDIIEGREPEFSRLAAQSSGHSERVVETPWATQFLSRFSGAKLLDVGFTMASPDYLGALLALEDSGAVEINAVDIVKPERVAGRYPEEWRERILTVPVDICDIRHYTSTKKYDLISCISTIEHVGFDVATYDDPKSAFERCENADQVVMLRDQDTDHQVLDSFSSLLEEGGYALISVPVGKGSPVLLQDSMGFYCAQWEYTLESWEKLKDHPAFVVEDEHFFQQTDDGTWQECGRITDIRGKTGEMKLHAEACAVVVLKKVTDSD